MPRTVIITNHDPKSPQVLNVPGLEGALHLAPAGRRGAESPPLTVDDLGPEVTQGVRARQLSVRDA